MHLIIIINITTTDKCVRIYVFTLFFLPTLSKYRVCFLFVLSALFVMSALFVFILFYFVSPLTYFVYFLQAMTVPGLPDRKCLFKDPVHPRLHLPLNLILIPHPHPLLFVCSVVTHGGEQECGRRKWLLQRRNKHAHSHTQGETRAQSKPQLETQP